MLTSPISWKLVQPTYVNAAKVAKMFYRSEIANEYPEWIPVIKYWHGRRNSRGHTIMCPFKYKDTEMPDDYVLYHDGGCGSFKAWRTHTGRVCAGQYYYFVKGADPDAIKEWIVGMHRIWPNGGYSTHFWQIDNNDGDGDTIYHGFHAGSCD
jgi:hypothetical protein